jgi:hypothetical protein
MRLILLNVFKEWPGRPLKDVGGETAPSQVIIVVYIKEDYRNIHQSPHLRLIQLFCRSSKGSTVPSKDDLRRSSSRKEKLNSI